MRADARLVGAILLLLLPHGAMAGSIEDVARRAEVAADRAEAAADRAEAAADRVEKATERLERILEKFEAEEEAAARRR